MIPLSVFAHLVGDGVVALVIGVPCAAIGFLVARRQPRNPLGWLFLVIAIFLFVPTVGGDYAYLDYRAGTPRCRSPPPGWPSISCGPRAWRCSSW